MTFKVDDQVRTSKYKNNFARGYISNYSEEVFVIKKVKNTAPWTYFISDLNGEEIIGAYYKKKKSKRQIKKNRKEKVIKRKGDKLYVKWQGYGDAFNNWIDKKDIAT